MPGQITNILVSEHNKVKAIIEDTKIPHSEWTDAEFEEAKKMYAENATVRQMAETAQSLLGMRMALMAVIELHMEMIRKLGGDGIDHNET